MRKHHIHLLRNVTVFPRIPHKRSRILNYFGIYTILVFFISIFSLPSGFLDNAVIRSLSPSSVELESDGGDLHNPALTFSARSSIRLNDSLVSFPGFTENRGQVSDPTLYYYFVQETYSIGFYTSHLQVSTRIRPEDPWESLTILFPGALPCVPLGVKQLPAILNYFNRRPVITGVPQWAEIHYKSLYPGITMRFYCAGNAIKYDFILAPYIDPTVIQLRLNSSRPIDIEITPSSVVCSSQTSPGLILWEDQLPIAYQIQKSSIPVTFRQIPNCLDCYGISIGEYDPSKQLVIDPLLLVYSTLFDEVSLYSFGRAVTFDSMGCIYITGRTANFPLVYPYDSTWNGDFDVFLAKLTADGQNLIYSTYLGGSSYDSVDGIVVDDIGNVYVAGITSSLDFPVLNAYDSTFNENTYDVFLTKLTADGQSLLFSTYLGGSEDDYSSGIAIDEVGCVYITGNTESSNFPTKNTFDATQNGGYDAFISKFAPDGQSLLFSTYLGGSNDDSVKDIVVDNMSCVHVSGFTESFDFPTINAYDANIASEKSDAFITKFAPDGQSLVYSTYLGGISYEWGSALSVDVQGCAYLTGFTSSSDFPTINAYDANIASENSDAFITKFAPDGQSLVYSTYLGGSDSESATDIAVDDIGCVYIIGTVRSYDFPTINAYDSTFNGGFNDAFVSKLAVDG